MRGWGRKNGLVTEYLYIAVLETLVIGSLPLERRIEVLQRYTPERMCGSLG